jgi:hypothetical protein
MPAHSSSERSSDELLTRLRKRPRPGEGLPEDLDSAQWPSDETTSVFADRNPERKTAQPMSQGKHSIPLTIHLARPDTNARGGRPCG